MVGEGGERRKACRVLQLFSHPLSNRISLISSKDFLHETWKKSGCTNAFFPEGAINCITACYFIPLFSLSVELQQ